MVDTRSSSSAQITKSFFWHADIPFKPVLSHSSRMAGVTGAQTVPRGKGKNLHQASNIDMEIKNATGVLTVGGFAALTAANSDRVGRKIRAGLNGHTTIEIDLSGTTIMDCAGLGTLIGLSNLARARNGGVRLLNPTPIVQRLFDVVRAGHMFDIVSTRPTDLP